MNRSTEITTLRSRWQNWHKRNCRGWSCASPQESVGGGMKPRKIKAVGIDKGGKGKW